MTQILYNFVNYKLGKSHFLRYLGSPIVLVKLGLSSREERETGEQ
jgi:hypothetical protein